MDYAPRGLRHFYDFKTAGEADVAARQTAEDATRDSIVIAADKYAKADKRLKTLRGLGTAGAVITVWPTSTKSYGADAAQAPYAEYKIKVSRGENVIRLRFLPTFPPIPHVRPALRNIRRRHRAASNEHKARGRDGRMGRHRDAGIRRKVYGIHVRRRQDRSRAHLLHRPLAGVKLADRGRQPTVAMPEGLPIGAKKRQDGKQADGRKAIHAVGYFLFFINRDTILRINLPIQIRKLFPIHLMRP